MAKIETLPDRPSLTTLTRIVKQLHDCMESRFDHAELDRKAHAARMEELGGKVETITTALGLTPDGQKPVALWSPRKALVGVASVGTAIFFFAKLIDALAPYAVPVAKALWKAAVGH